MKSITTVRSLTALLCCVLMMAPLGFAQQAAPPPAPSVQVLRNTPTIRKSRAGKGPLYSVSSLDQFSRPDIPPVNLVNSGRLEQLIRAGNIYLSLEDAIALALENNLDIEMSRYGPQIAQSDYLAREGRRPASRRSHCGAGRPGERDQPGDRRRNRAERRWQ